jgi:hypothetical protein
MNTTTQSIYAANCNQDPPNMQCVPNCILVITLSSSISITLDQAFKAITETFFSLPLRESNSSCAIYMYVCMYIIYVYTYICIHTCIYI